MEPCPLFDSTDPECLECPDNPDAIIPVKDVETGEPADLHVGTLIFLAKRTMDMEHESALFMDAYREALEAWRRAYIRETSAYQKEVKALKDRVDLFVRTSNVAGRVAREAMMDSAHFEAKLEDLYRVLEGWWNGESAPECPACEGLAVNLPDESLEFDSTKEG